MLLASGHDQLLRIAFGKSRTLSLSLEKKWSFALWLNIPVNNLFTVERILVLNSFKLHRGGDLFLDF